MIVDSLRNDIVDGKLPLGSKLPARVDVEKLFDASSVTVQRALVQLQREGFVRVDRTLATYVSDLPPHLSHYTLVFPTSPHIENPWNLWYDALLRASSIVAEHRGITIEPAYDIGRDTSTASYIRLVDQIQSRRVAGVVFATPPFELYGTPIYDHPGVPRVVAAHFDQLSCVRSNVKAVEMAMNVLRQSGRCRVAVFANSGQDVSGFADAIRQHGLETGPFWIQRVSVNHPDTARDVVSLLMSTDNRVHPDAIYIDDDNLVDPVIAALLSAGVRVPADLEIVAHTNLPMQAKSVVPVRRFGMDARMVVSRCIDSLDRQRAGDASREVIELPLLFDEELVSDAEASAPSAEV